MSQTKTRKRRPMSEKGDQNRDNSVWNRRKIDWKSRAWKYINDLYICRILLCEPTQPNVINGISPLPSTLCASDLSSLFYQSDSVCVPLRAQELLNALEKRGKFAGHATTEEARPTNGTYDEENDNNNKKTVVRHKWKFPNRTAQFALTDVYVHVCVCLCTIR